MTMIDHGSLPEVIGRALRRSGIGNGNPVFVNRIYEALGDENRASRFVAGLEQGEKAIRQWAEDQWTAFRADTLTAMQPEGRAVAPDTSSTTDDARDRSSMQNERETTRRQVRVFGGVSAATFDLRRNGRVALELAYVDASGVTVNGKAPCHWYDKHVTTFTFNEAAQWIAVLAGRLPGFIVNGNVGGQIYHRPASSEEDTRVSLSHQGSRLFLSVAAKHCTQTRNNEIEGEKTIWGKGDNGRRQPVVQKEKRGEIIEIKHALPIPIEQAPELMVLFARSMCALPEGEGLSIHDAIQVSLMTMSRVRG